MEGLIVVSDEPYYKGLVTVKDAKDNEVFVWHSGTAYIVDAVLGGDTDNLALATVNTAPSSGGAGRPFRAACCCFISMTQSRIRPILLTQMW